jgi:hypothetical protein
VERISRGSNVILCSPALNAFLEPGGVPKVPARSKPQRFRLARMPLRLVERTHSTFRFDFVADVNTEHRLITSVLAMKRTRAAVAFLVLAFLRDRKNFRRITCDEYVAL